MNQQAQGGTTRLSQPQPSPGSFSVDVGDDSASPTRPMISADNHLNTHWLPRDLWQSRLPLPFREQGPRVVETETGSYWQWEGKLQKRSADGSSHAQMAHSEYGALRLEPGMLPPSQPELAVTHLDWAGVDAAVFFGDTRKWSVADPQLRVAMVRAYNDFCLELTAQQPRRLLYLPCLSTQDVEACVPELARLIDRGIRAVEFGVFDVARPLHDPIWEEIWAMAEAHDVVICSHTGHPAGTPFESSQHGAFHAAMATSAFQAARPIADMVFSGVFERHPRLKWVMAECRIGWLPFLFTWMDRQIEIRRNQSDFALSRLPSTFIRKQVRFTFEDDPVGAHFLANDFGFLKEVVMWAMDYPHPQGMWPDPSKKIEAMFAGLDQDLSHQILYQRAASLFGIGST